MEHRWSNRKDFVCDIRLYHLGRYLGTYRTSNLSADGIYIKNSTLWLRKGAAVEVVLRWENSRRRMRGIVVHQAAGGLGLMFSDPGLHEVLAAQEVLEPPPLKTRAAGARA